MRTVLTVVLLLSGCTWGRALGGQQPDPSSAREEILRALEQGKSEMRLDTLPSSVPLPDSISILERVRALDRIVPWRVVEISDGAAFGACSVYRALGGETEIGQLAPTTREHVRDDSAMGCERGSDIRPPHYPWWVLESFRRDGRHGLIVKGTLIGASGNRHTEMFYLTGRPTEQGLAVLTVRSLTINEVRIQ